MIPKFSELIERIEMELCKGYLPGAIRWADETYDFAWSNAIDRFQNSLIKAMETRSYTFLEMESKVYKETVICLMKMYKESNQLNDAQMFLKNLRVNA